MAFVFIDPRRHTARKRRIKKSVESQRVLDALDAYLEGNYQEPMRWLVHFWRDQATVLTYKELRSIVIDEDEPEKLFDNWYQDYSKLLNEKMTSVWESAFRAGADSNPVLEGVVIDNSDVYVRDWIVNHTGNLITNVTEDQVNAVRYIVAESKAVRMGSDETARYIRPIVGLTERQAQANLKHYTTVKEKLQEDHPRMRPENIERKARESAAKYAQKQQMYRAETISRTEIAQAYNQGNDVLIKQAMEQGLIPIQKKVWSTAMDGHVCEACESLEGTEVEMDGHFSATVGVKVRRTMTTALPPMHPRCKCAVMYESTGEYMTPDNNLQQENTIANQPEYDTINTDTSYPIMTGGKRNEEELTDDQLSEVRTQIELQGYAGQVIVSNSAPTAFHGSVEGDRFHYLVIGTDVYPTNPPGDTSNEKVSMSGCIAHEIVGHYEAWAKGTTQLDAVLEEVQASIRASKFGVELTDWERGVLFDDAMDRLNKAGIKFEDVESLLDIWER